MSGNRNPSPPKIVSAVGHDKLVSAMLGLQEKPYDANARGSPMTVSEENMKAFVNSTPRSPTRQVSDDRTATPTTLYRFQNVPETTNLPEQGYGPPGVEHATSDRMPKASDDANRIKEDTSATMNVFKVSPVRHAPAENVFGTPDRPENWRELVEEGRLRLEMQPLGEPGPALENESDQLQTAGDDALEKRVASRSPEGQKNAKKIKKEDTED